MPDLLAHLRRDGHRQVGGRIAGREVEQREDDEADDEQRRDREQQPPERVVRTSGAPSVRSARAAQRRGPGGQ